MPKREYFVQHDFYNLKSDDELTILPKFRTRQHTLHSSCGPNAVLMILNYFGDDAPEAEIYDAVHCRENIGTRLDDIAKYLRERGYEIETSIEHAKDADGKCFGNMAEFQDFVVRNLAAGHPILVESVYFGGHYQVIIGYDRRSEGDDYSEDILILADSSDTGDGNVDGYVIRNAYKFYYGWFDDRYLPVEHRQQPYIVVKGKK